MSGNVLINGRTTVHAGSGGTLTTVDVCYTKIGKPIKDIPYTNIAKSADAADTAASVLINGHPVCHRGSNFAVSTGDEPGDHYGVISGTIQGKAEFISSSANVFIEGMAAVRQGDLMVSNNKNTPPMPLVQPGAGAPKAKAKAGAEEKAGETPDEIAWGVGGKSPVLKGGFLGRSDAEGGNHG